MLFHPTCFPTSRAPPIGRYVLLGFGEILSTRPSVPPPFCFFTPGPSPRMVQDVEEGVPVQHVNPPQVTEGFGSQLFVWGGWSRSENKVRREGWGGWRTKSVDQDIGGPWSQSHSRVRRTGPFWCPPYP